MSPPPTDGAGRFKDIVCVECQNSFVPSSRQVEKFENVKIPLPDRCPKCKGQVCDTFRDTRACPYGETYTFLHPEEVAGEIPDMRPEVVKHSYPCRLHAVGKCLAGEDCKFQHGDKPGGVFSMLEVEPVLNHIDPEAAIQDTYIRFPSELVILRPRRKVVTNMDDDDHNQ